MTQKEQIIAAEDESEITLATPRFDETEAETARPVVPLDSVSPADRGIVITAPSPREMTSSGRRPWTLALVLGSALVGVIVGGVALRLYQGYKTPASTAIVTSTAPPAAAPPSTDATANAEDTEISAIEPLVAASDENNSIAKPIEDAAETAAGSKIQPTDERAAAIVRKPESTRENDAAGPALRKLPVEREERDRMNEERAEKSRELPPPTPPARTVRVETPEPPRAAAPPVVGRVEPGPRRSERVEDIFGGERRPRDEQPRREAPRDPVRSIFEGVPPR